MIRRATIGLDRAIELDWLDAAAARVAQGGTIEDVRDYLRTLLEEPIPGFSARKKTATVLTHVWAQSTNATSGLRERAIELVREGELSDRLGLHWAMMIGTYPFFVDVASAIGRLSTLQGDVALTQVTRRMVADWGDRSTIVRATRRLVRSMVGWGVLRDTKTRGIYVLNASPRDVPDKLALLLIEAILVDSEQDSVPVSQLTGHPALFPFRLTAGPSQLRDAAQFVVHREGLDVDLVGVG